MEILEESKELQKAIEQSMFKFDDANPDLGGKAANLPKSRNNRKRSKARGIIDDDEEENEVDDNNDVVLDVHRVVKENEGAIYGSDEQNYNQNNIDLDQGLELKLNREAFFDVEEKDQEKGKKSVEVADMKHFADLNG